MPENDMYIAGIGHAVNELLSFNPIWTGGDRMAPWGFLLNISKTV